MIQRQNASMVGLLSPNLSKNRGESHLSSIAVNAAYSAAKESLILVTAGAGGVTVTLPLSANNYGKVYWVKKVDAAVGVVTVARSGADLIDGAATTVLANQYDAVGLIADGGTAWELIGVGAGGGIVPPPGYCWLYCVATETTYGGVNAASAIAGADYCVALGWGAMRHNVTGDYNTAVGAEAGEGVAANSYIANSFFGYQAGHGTTTGDENVFVGCEAGHDNAIGDMNVMVGRDAGYCNITDDENVCIGYSAGFGNVGDSYDENVLVGAYAGYNIETASANVGVGYSALYFITTGYLNTAVGYDAGMEITTGTLNTFVGGDAGGDCKTGDGNTFVGYAAGFTGAAADQSGDYNTGVGASCASSLTTGAYNVLMGYTAGSALSTESDNTFVGTGAGSLALCASSVLLGHDAGQNCIRDNTLYIANSNTATPLLYGEFDNAELGINVGAGCAGTLHVDQSSATGAKPVLVLDQADVDVVLMKVIGTAAAASADRTLVAASDYGTPGALMGWIQIEVQDDGNRVADADYWIPFHATPS